MTIFTYLFFGLLALVSTLLDISFFSFLPVGGASILTTFIILIILASFDLRYYSVIFSAFAVLFYTGLSSVPVYYIAIMFVAIPILVFYIRKRILFELSYFSFLSIIVGSTFLFEIIYLLIEFNFSSNTIYPALMFVLINSLFGIVLFSLSKKITHKFKITKN